ACAVRSEQSEDFAGVDFEVDALHGGKFAVGFLESFHLDGMRHEGSSILIRCLTDLRAHFVELAPGKGILPLVTRQLLEKALRIARTLLSESDRRQQDLRERAEVVAFARHQLKPLDAALLIAIDVLEFDEPADKERQAADHVLRNSGGEVRVVKLRV